MAVSTMLANIGESSGRNRVLIWWPSHVYMYRRLWSSPCLIARRRPKDPLARAHLFTRVTLNRSDNRPTLESLGL
ncbi:Uncharacterized protein TCM_022942 [Theobroma cacao]|uniref:Uncharacterized protein n=1 Tax=Theobroma cacao TaxID=3641 RepID=A0A061EUI2_THECC|nr:Uncharacterized protein TCM_022942 [Theobroma cacao]